jgi:hypothetical protein
MKNTPSGFGESGQTSGSRVTILETVMVCTIDPTKSGEQIPECTIKQVRVLNQTPGPSDSEPPEIEESLVSDGDTPKVSTGTRNDQMCPIPSRNQTPEEVEAATINCLMKSHEKKETESSIAERNSTHYRRNLNNRKRDTS